MILDTKGDRADRQLVSGPHQRLTLHGHLVEIRAVGTDEIDDQQATVAVNETAVPAANTC